MRRITHIILMLAAFIFCLMPHDDLWAKGGRGGSKGGAGKSFKGGASSRGKGGSSKVGAGPADRGKRKHSFNVGHEATNRNLDDGERPWSKHHAREQRKLDHRRRVADHLREISDRNGNEHLKQVADDMDERAQAHYDKQMEKIRQKYGLEETPTDGVAPETAFDNPLGGDSGSFDDSREVLNSTDNSLDEVAPKLTGRENALLRQLRNEEWKLAKRMEEVERMRAMAEQTGDDGMIQAADRLEEQALNHFHQRMTNISEFRQRHGLPEVSQHLAR
jgi:hypothetical protein